MFKPVVFLAVVLLAAVQAQQNPAASVAEAPDAPLAPVAPPKPTCVAKPCAPPTANSSLCASDGKTYESSCSFSDAQCLDPSLVVVHKGDCEANTTTAVVPKPKCIAKPCAPPTANSSVCASDGKTYESSCTFSDAQCLDPSLVIVHKGDCTAQTTPVVPATKCIAKPCAPPTANSSVCASDGKTYESSCAFSDAQCLDPSLVIAHKGNCKTKKTRKHAPVTPVAPPKPSCVVKPCAPPTATSSVCASDGKTYESSCTFSYTHCLNASIVIVHNGDCTV